MIKKILLIMIGIVLLIGFISANTGCCFDISTGLCSSNAEQTACENLNGEFTQTDNCNSVSRCTKGCCILSGESVEYLTSRSCELMSRSIGIEYNWQGGVSQEQCLEIAGQKEVGACTYGGEYEKECDFTTKGDCIGEFHSGLLCTAPELNTLCLPTKKTTCVEAKDEVYFLDSCGNRANIYDADKTEDADYWRYIRNSNQSCNPDQSNAESQDCGNCDYNLGSTCGSGKPKYGDKICKDLNCKDIEGHPRKNGESWCEFEKSGPYAQDVSILEVEHKVYTPVGSRFIRRYCLNGNVYTEPCGDFRTESCSKGECTLNPSYECFLANPTSTSEEQIIDESLCDEKYCYIWEGFDCVTQTIPGQSKPTNYCGESRDTYKDNRVAGDSVTESQSGPLEDLGLDMCLPKIPGGNSFWESGGGADCSLGDFTATMDFKREFKHYGTYGGMTTKDWYYVPPTGKSWGNIGLIYQLYLILDKDKSPPTKTWNIPDYIVDLPGGSIVRENFVDAIMIDGASGGFITNPQVEELLNARCQAIGDCDGKGSWVSTGVGHWDPTGDVVAGITGMDTSDSSSTTGSLGISKTSYKSFTYTYKCKPYMASGSNCEKCGQDSVPCSEYRCKAIGTRCEYNEPAGADRGYCKPSSDVSPPKITPLETFISENHSYSSVTLSGFSIKPDVLPNTAIQFGVKTDEDAICKFDIGISGNKFDDMEYEFGETWGREHKIVLSLPGQTAASIANASEHNIITEGDFNIYVRCMDGAENWHISPFLIKLKVMDTPDTIAPIISNFNPSSGFRIKYNTTEQEVSFDINEPAECRWDFQDKEFENMTTNFTCSEELSDYGALNGYSCSGLLTGVTNDTERLREYYIRCKDQPWLEGKEDEIYQRNTNFESKKYILKASYPFSIIDISPRGEVVKSVADINVSIRAETYGGCCSGKAVCIWQLDDNNPHVFYNTNSSKHSQILANRSEGSHNITIGCVDEAGNIDIKSSLFSLRIDQEDPKILRTYYAAGKLKMITDENAQCKYTSDTRIGCGYSFSNTSIGTMSGSRKEHTILWEDDQSHYIKCQDFFGNTNPGCGIIIRTY